MLHQPHRAAQLQTIEDDVELNTLSSRSEKLTDVDIVVEAEPSEYDSLQGRNFHSDDGMNNDQHKKTIYRDGEMRRRTGEGRWAAVRQGLKTNVSNFFGVGDDETVEKWKERVERMHATNKLLGRGYKQREFGETPTSAYPMTSGLTPFSTGGPSFHIQTARTPHVVDPLRIPMGRQTSRLSVTSTGRRLQRGALLTPQTGKDSVFRMAFDGFQTLITSGQKDRTPGIRTPGIRTPGIRTPGIRTPAMRTPVTLKRSFIPQQLTAAVEGSTPGGLTPAMARRAMVRTPGADSVFQSLDELDDVFYDEPTPTSAAVWTQQGSSLRYRGQAQQQQQQPGDEKDVSDNVVKTSQSPQTAVHPLASFNSETPVFGVWPSKPGWQPGRSKPEPLPGDTPGSLLPNVQGSSAGNKFEGMCRISKAEIESYLAGDAGRRQIGKGFAGFLTDAEYRMSRLDNDIQEQMISMDDHRPYFTYWVTVVQIICYIVSVVVYGIASVGFSVSVIQSEVLKSNLAIEKAHFLEDNNLWIGPRQADLIHLGAKYSPCMRRDENVVKAIAEDQRIERETACCIRNDRSGCVQASRTNCSATLATWKKWNGTTTNSRTSGTVCGLDYRYCQNPPRDIEELWPDDITKWPTCIEEIPVPDGSKTDDHMTCKIQGRPCCIGIQGECIITTREHCSFLRGYFHQESTLCSQVSCMSEICGMIPFINPSYPDQFYRLFISLFVHAGLLQLLITVVFQFFVMRDLEKLAGTLRISIIYIASGIAGSLSSAIFLPYHVEAGPTGSQFGLLACLFVEVIQNWYILQSPVLALFRLGLILIVLFVVGLLPMVDNYAHLVGFVFGFLLAFALLPYITFNVCDRRCKAIGVVVCLFGASGFLVGLFILFYVAPLYNCPNCHYFNCLPITSDFCRSMEVKIGRVQWYS